jgi:glutamate-5-semialdehyde dehydrogenase
MVEVPLKLYVQGLLKQAKAVARPMACLSSEQKNQALQAMADALVDKTSDILEANERDLQLIPKEGGQQAHRQAVQQIGINEDDIHHMVEALLGFLAYPDPVGEMSQAWMTPDGLHVHTVRAPIGVLGVISDMGPLMTVQSLGMCVKTNNVCVYRGGPEWLQTNETLFRCLKEAAVEQGVPEGALVPWFS